MNTGCSPARWLHGRLGEANDGSIRVIGPRAGWFVVKYQETGMFPRLSATSRLAAGLAGISLSVLLLSFVIGLFPQTQRHVFRDRQQVAASVAAQAVDFSDHGDSRKLSAYLAELTRERQDLVSVGVRLPDGQLLASAGNHKQRWNLASAAPDTSDQLRQPIDALHPGATVEVRFQPLGVAVLTSLLFGAELRYALFVAFVSSLAFYLYLHNIFRQLRNSRVVSSSVRDSLDSMQEGLLIMDVDERIVLVNRAFELCIGNSSKELIGKPISRARFAKSQELAKGEEPWTSLVRSGDTVSGRIVRLRNGDKDEQETYSVSAAPINDEHGHPQGTLASFEDVTSLERKKHELNLLVDHLRKSTEEIQRQNRELERLATRDPLTGCLNRRSFYERFDAVWKSSERYGKPISAIMLDIDFFKKINDYYGHSCGDDVLVKVGAALVQVARESDIVCRYGGEEFAVVLPETEIGEAFRAAERFRTAVGALAFEGFAITASLGCSSFSEEVEDPQQLLDQADRCLYVAKNSGRNQVVRWDHVPADYQFDEGMLQVRRDSGSGDHSSIPFHAVTALVSALAYRDHATAAHSRRVADLCVAVAEGLLSLTECYTLEIAALLHDIGKIGVPDSILLKPGPLSDEEWEVMRQNDRIGVEIIRASFASVELTEIVEHYPRHFEDTVGGPDGETGEATPLGARILAIADAYDSMVNDRVFRKGCPREAAFTELRRCAGTQFDPELVERLIAVVEVRSFEVSSSRRVSKETALGIGLQIEQLSKAVDRQDMSKLKASSQRLAIMAQREGANEIAEKAASLDQILTHDRDLLAVVATANQLLELCRATQAVFLNHPQEAASPF